MKTLSLILIILFINSLAFARTDPGFKGTPYKHGSSTEANVTDQIFCDDGSCLEHIIPLQPPRGTQALIREHIAIIKDTSGELQNKSSSKIE